MKNEPNAPGNAKVTTRTIDPPLYTEKVCRVKELEDELKMVKGQVIVSLSKAKRADKREDFIPLELSRASETIKCKLHKAPSHCLKPRFLLALLLYLCMYPLETCR
jgi:hypothetical protein